MGRSAAEPRIAERDVTDDKGLAEFDLIRERRHHVGADLCAFDMLELDGEGLRRTRIEGARKRTLAMLLGRFQPGIVMNEYFEGDAAIIYQHACALVREGIVSKTARDPVPGWPIASLA